MLEKSIHFSPFPPHVVPAKNPAHAQCKRSDHKISIRGLGVRTSRDTHLFGLGESLTLPPSSSSSSSSSFRCSPASGFEINASGRSARRRRRRRCSVFCAYRFLELVGIPGTDGEKTFIDRFKSRG